MSELRVEVRCNAKLLAFVSFKVCMRRAVCFYGLDTAAALKVDVFLCMCDNLSINDRGDALSKAKDFEASVVVSIPQPFAYLESIDEGAETDFFFVDVNPAFGELSGLNREAIKGKRVSDVFARTNGKKGWPGLFRKAFRDETEEPFLYQFDALDALFDVVVRRVDDHRFSVLLHDVTAIEQEKQGLQTLLTSLQEFLKLPAELIDYQMLTDHLLKLSGARYAALNTYEDNQTKTVTRAVSGPGRAVRLASKVLGFSLVGKEWDVIPERLEDIKHNQLIHYDSLYEAAYGAISKRTASLLEKLAGIKESYVLQIVEQQTIVGDFILFMPKKKTLELSDAVRIFANQAGIMILRKKAAEKIHYLQYHDVLTNVYNRAYLEEVIQGLNQLEKTRPTLIMADLDGLKLTNDVYGHSAGDAMLKAFADILKEACPDSAFISRWGGDEFVIVLTEQSRSDIKALIRNIERAGREKTVYNLPIFASLGHATKIAGGRDIKDVLKEAEAAMYEAKFASSDTKRQAYIDALFETLTANSHESDAHVRTMWDYTKRLAQAAGVEESTLQSLHTAVSWHDIGKVPLSETALKKPSSLTQAEWEKMRRHPQIGYRLVMTLTHDMEAARAVLHHHEHWDGSGYPEGLKQKDIPLYARILAIVDAYVVMRAGRPYQKALSLPAIIDEFNRCSGTQFDPELTRLFLSILATTSTES